MSSKTKIVVLHLKELIYTGIFVALGILFIVLLVIMFLPGDKEKTDGNTENTETAPTQTETTEASYIPGVYTTSLELGDHTVDVEVIVDQDYISSIRLVNLEDAITTMYPLIQPSLEALADQIYEKQSLEGITYPNESRYTSLVLLEAIRSALEKASLTLDVSSGGVEEGILP